MCALIGGDDSVALTDRQTLVVVAGAQLAAQVAGLTVALRRRLPYDVKIVGMRGEPDAVGADAWDKGTALSAPITMLGVQAAALARLASGGGRLAPAVLGGLGLLNVGGYLGERVVRLRLSPRGWDPVETPLAATGLGLAAAMGVLGLRRLVRG